MNDNEQLIDQSQLAEGLSKKILYKTLKCFLVKPLDPVMVKKAFDKPVSKDTSPKKDENGIEAIDFEDVETEIKEVESDYRKGVVLKVPFDYQQMINGDNFKQMEIKVGDVIIYPNRAAKWFDLLKDTQLVNHYDIIGVEEVKE